MQTFQHEIDDKTVPRVHGHFFNKVFTMACLSNGNIFAIISMEINENTLIFYPGNDIKIPTMVITNILLYVDIKNLLLLVHAQREVSHQRSRYKRFI